MKPWGHGGTDTIVRFVIFLLFIVLSNVILTAKDDPRKLFRDSIGAEKIVIINADDFGKTHAANIGVISAIEKGFVTTTTMITPALQIKEAFDYLTAHPNVDAGVHLTLAIEKDLSPYGPVLPAGKVPSLVDENGHFFTTIAVVTRMKPSEIQEELNAQIQKAIHAGINITHLDCHMGFYHGDIQTLKIVLNLAKKYDLPMRLPNAGFANYLLREGIMTTDTMLPALRRKPGEGAMEVFDRLLRELKPGITEVITHPAVSGLDEYDTVWRQDELDMWLDPDVIKKAQNSGIRFIGYREMRDFQRKMKKKD